MAVELPSDITDIPQTYKVNCIIAGTNVDELDFYYGGIELSPTICTGSDAFSCNETLDNDNKERFTSDSTPNELKHGLLFVIWKAKKINSGAFRQNNNYGDHRIRCYAKKGSLERNSDYITVKGSTTFVTIV